MSFDLYLLYRRCANCPFFVLCAPASTALKKRPSAPQAPQKKRLTINQPHQAFLLFKKPNNGRHTFCHLAERLQMGELIGGVN